VELGLWPVVRVLRDHDRAGGGELGQRGGQLRFEGNGAGGDEELKGALARQDEPRGAGVVGLIGAWVDAIPRGSDMLVDELDLVVCADLVADVGAYGERPS